MKFQSKIIIGDKYRKWKKIRGWLFIFWFFIGFPVWYTAAKDRDAKFYNDFKNFNFSIPVYIYIGLTVVAAIFYFLLTHLSYKYKPVGEFEIDERGVFIDTENEQKQWSYQEIELLEIIRNTSYHKFKHDESEKVFPGDNFIKIIDKQGELWEYEFLIKHESHDQEFQQMIHELKFNNIQGRRFLSV